MTTTTFSSLESSGSDQYIEGTDFEVSEFFPNFEEWGMAETESMGFNGQSQDFGCQGNEFYDQFGGSSNQQQNVEESSSKQVFYNICLINFFLTNEINKCICT